jgi:arylsulfatase A-like enzyme
MSIETTMSNSRDLKSSRWKFRDELLNKSGLKGKDLVRAKYQEYMRDYLACVAGVDENVGRLLQYLKDNDLEDNTVVMYSADQGFYLGEHGWFDKRFMYEESFRTPLLAKWPGVIQAGSVNQDLVQNIDFAETFLDMAKTEIPSDMQGKSLVPIMKGETPSDWRESLYYHYYEYPTGHRVRRHEGVTTGRYKLIRFYGLDVPNGEEWELYDLERDKNEVRNEYSNPEYASVVANMKTELQDLREKYEVVDIPQAGTKKK